LNMWPSHKMRTINFPEAAAYTMGSFRFAIFKNVI